MRSLCNKAVPRGASDFTVKHFHEQLVKRRNYKLCYTVTKLSLQAAGLAARANRVLRDRFVPDYNARFAVPATKPGSAFVPYVDQADRGRALCPGGSRGRRRQLRLLAPAQPLQFRPSAIAITTSAPPCACINIPTAGSPSSPVLEGGDAADEDAMGGFCDAVSGSV